MYRIHLFVAYLCDKDNYKDDPFGMPGDAMLDKEDHFYVTDSSKTQVSSDSYPASDRINLIEPQQMEQSGFVGEAGEVSYDEGLSWHPIQPLSDNKLDTGLSSFDPLDVVGGRRGILRNSRRDPEGGVSNVSDCDIDAEGLTALEYIGNNFAQSSGNYTNLQGDGLGHQLGNGFAGMADSRLIQSQHLNQQYPQTPEVTNMQGKNNASQCADMY